MPTSSRCEGRLKLLMLFGLLVLAPTAGGQGAPTLLRVQRSRAELNIAENRQDIARNANAVALRDRADDVWNYPNSASCLVVYNDGKYVLEKRNEQTLGKPKIKSAEGVLTADDLQQLKAILDDEGLKKVRTPKTPDLPPDTQALREAESLDVQIDRAGTRQSFTMIKERVKTGALVSATSGPSTGTDTFLDNEAPYKKTLGPLMRWFEGLEKKSKSAFKESKPQYCLPLNIG